MNLDISGLLTPYKYGKPLLAGSGKEGDFAKHAVDCPFVFKHRGRFYMMYVGFDGIGYQTALSASDNLLDWTHCGMILQRNQKGAWNSNNVAGTWIMRDNDINGTGTLKKWRGRYWLSFHAYPNFGYEEGSAKIGLAWTEDENLLDWHCLEDPVLVPENGDAWERGGLYKECLLEHEGIFYLFYNAKNKNRGRWTEQIGLATSSDMADWKRYQDNPVLHVSQEAWDSGFASDPCVLKDKDRWVMYYFGYNFKHAQEGVAVSEDLMSWHKYADPIIKVGEVGELDSTFAHKPSVISHEGILYHFYTASRPPKEGDKAVNVFPEFRSITVAASRPF